MVGGSARDRIVNRMIDEIEGGYSNHRADSGGRTMWGWTEANARARGWTGPMNELPREMAVRWYCDRWDQRNLDPIAALSEPVAAEVFDTGENMGPAVAAKFLQRSLNALNRRQRDFPDIDVDGGIGPETVGALSDFLAFRGRAGEVVLLRCLNALQGERYIWLAEHREKDEAFVFGWFDKRVVVR